MALTKQISQDWGQLPLSFEANHGQTGSDVEFLARGQGYTLYLKQTEVVLALTKSSVVPQTPDLVTGFGGLIESPDIKAEPPAVLSMRLVGANATAEVTGLDQLPGITNYLAGNDPAAWHTNIPTFSRVRYEEVYPGVNVVYYGNQRKLEYDFIVAPGFDPSVINMSFGGADELGLDGQVNLVVSVDSGQVNLSDGNAADSGPSWSPDGARIAFTRDNDIFLMSADGSNLVAGTSGPGRNWQPAWKP